MLTYLRNLLCPNYHNYNQLKEQTNNTLMELQATIDEQNTIITNYINNTLQQFNNPINITDHACHRYQQRFHSKQPIEDIRKYLFRGMLRHLAVFDKLVDGRYDLGKNETAKVINNTVVTVYKRRGKK